MSENLPKAQMGFIFVPLSRGRAATRAVLWLVPALLLCVSCYLIYGKLNFSANAVSNRIVDFAVATAALPLVILMGFCVMRFVQYTLMVCWFSPLGVRAGAEFLELRLGPFGSAGYRSAELDIRYPFELSGDFEDGGFEQFLPEEEQISRLLPRILHQNSPRPINRTFIRFLRGDERAIANSLRPAIEYWRSTRR